MIDFPPCIPDESLIGASIARYTRRPLPRWPWTRFRLIVHIYPLWQRVERIAHL